MNLGILQLSDLHLSGLSDPLLAKAEKIADALRGNVHDDCHIVVLYTGDVAYSGTNAEYAAAVEFEKRLSAALSSIGHLSVAGVALVPGNHDCNFAIEGDARAGLMGSVQDRLDTIDLDGDTLSLLLKVEHEFFAFEGELNPLSNDGSSRLGWLREFHIGGRRVHVRCLNTALFSKLHEQPGQLFFPIRAFPKPDDPADLAVTIFHHPYNWLEPSNARQLKRLVEQNSDIVLTGHEHERDVYSRVAGQDEETNYVEGAALKSAGETGFNFIIIDLAVSTYQILPFRWKDDIFEPHSPISKLFVRKQARLDELFENNPAFVAELDDVGTGFTHRKGKLTVGDLFVYPDLKISSFTSKDPVGIGSERVLNFVFEREFVHIAGPPLSGKSTLARVLYSDLHRLKRMVPLLIKGESLKARTPSDLHKLVERQFEQQYSRVVLPAKTGHLS